MTTLLHVEDDIALAEAIKEAFEAFGFRGAFVGATTVADAQAIIADLESYPKLDLIISDMHLPDGSGLDVIRSARSHPVRSHVPIVVLSGDISSGLVNRAYVLGANSFVSKGSRGRSVVQVINALYEHWLKDARLPSSSTTTTRTARGIARSVYIRNRKTT